MALPRHVAIIMDGNGRWAQKKGRPRVFGHIKGARVAREIITDCVKRKIQFLTLFAFSTENWKRPEAEVSFLMRLLERHLIRERSKLIRENIRFMVLGDVSRLPSAVNRELAKTTALTAGNTGMTLVVALNYGGRQEIVRAAQALAASVADGSLTPSEITEELFAKKLSGAFLPDPDLIIRTSGEFRLSNFLTWQSAYSELFITPTLWPDFTASNLTEALKSFESRDRRFGSLSPEITV